MFQERQSSALSCNHQLSMLILLQNIDFSKRVKFLLLPVIHILCFDAVHIKYLPYSRNLSVVVLGVFFALCNYYLILSFHSFVFLLLATWRNYFNADNHLWFTSGLQRSQHIPQYICSCCQIFVKNLFIMLGSPQPRSILLVRLNTIILQNKLGLLEQMWGFGVGTCWAGVRLKSQEGECGVLD